jgi:hypothetical protein
MVTVRVKVTLKLFEEVSFLRVTSSEEASLGFLRLP